MAYVFHFTYVMMATSPWYKCKRIPFLESFMSITLDIMGFLYIIGNVHTRKIRKELGLQSLKIVALTGELMDEKWASDFNGVLNKPAKAESLRQEITRHLPDWQKPV